MKLIPDPSTLRAALRDPLVWGGLAIDLIPIYAVLALGWKASPLVLLYWLENGVIGLFTALRMLAAGVVQGPVALVAALFLTAFFAVHYGMFWFVHGVFVVFLTLGEPGVVGEGAEAGTFPAPPGLIEAALGAAPAMPVFIGLVIAWSAVVFVVDFLLRGEVGRSDLHREMMSPYGRVIVLHFGIFASFFALMALGDPAIGALALIILYAAYNFLQRARARARTGGEGDLAPDAAP
ncbi:hypothetical protein GC169_01510 [bacterium]|nr:hypothetical protein [bacterium]